jgi:hypothetical protein
MSDDRTPEQLKAQDDLQIAIENHVIAFRAGTSDQVEVTGDWMVIASVQSINLEDNERRYAYHLGFSGGEQPEHIALGLLRLGEQLITEGEAKE